MLLNHSQPHVQAQEQAVPSADAAVTQAQGLAERRRLARGFPAMDVVEDNAEDTF